MRQLSSAIARRFLRARRSLTRKMRRGPVEPDACNCGPGVHYDGTCARASAQHARRQKRNNLAIFQKARLTKFAGDAALQKRPLLPLRASASPHGNASSMSSGSQVISRPPQGRQAYLQSVQSGQEPLIRKPLNQMRCQRKVLLSPA